MDGTLFFIHGNEILNSCCVSNGVNEAGCLQLLNFGFDQGNFGGMDWKLILAYGNHIKPCVDVVLNNGWIQPRNFSVGLGKDVAEFLQESFEGSDFFQGAG